MSEDDKRLMDSISEEEKNKLRILKKNKLMKRIMSSRRAVLDNDYTRCHDNLKEAIVLCKMMGG
jgi:hypothetical protein